MTEAAPAAPWLGVRTIAVGVLAAVVGIRTSAGTPLDGVAARVAADPVGALARSVEGWTLTGTMGDASAADLRAVPLALLHATADVVDASATVAQAAWAALVLVLAVVGARRLASDSAVAERAADGRHVVDGGGQTEPWAPWVAALVYACGPVLVATTSRSPLDGLVAATLPWILAPVVRREGGWVGAARSAAWLGLAGVGSPHWAAAALAAGALAASVAWRGELRQLLRWLVLSLLACAWWGAVLVWESGRSTDVTALVTSGDVRDQLGAAIGRPSWDLLWLVMVVAGPLAVAAAALALRLLGADRGLVAGLLGLSVVAALALASGGWAPPVLAPAALDGAVATWGPVLAWWGLGAVLAWEPVVAYLRWRVGDLGLPFRDASQLTTLLVLSTVVLSCLGVVVAVQEQPSDSTADPSGVWAEVAAWSRQAPPGRVLVLPATTGRLDPVVQQALGGRSWVGRDSLPASLPSATAALDDTVRRVIRGENGLEVFDGLRRLGVSYVLLRDDLAAEADRRRPAALVRASLRAGGASRLDVMPGDNATHAPSGLVDRGVRSAVPQVEVWAVDDVTGVRQLDGEPLDVAGDAGSTADLTAAGVLGGRALRLVEDEGAEAQVVSDSARRRDVDQREALDPDGPVLEAGEPRVVVPPGAAPGSTAVRRLAGVKAVTASSSISDLGVERRSSGAEAVAGADGNIFTAWQSEPGSTRGEWWEVTFDSPVQVSGTTVQVVQNVFGGQLATRLQVRTDGYTWDVDVPSDGLVTLTQAEVTSSLRITAKDFTGTAATDSFGLAEVSVPGVAVRDELVLTRPAVSGWVLAARPGSQARCVLAAPVASAPDDDATVCDRTMSVPGADTGSLDRVVPTKMPLTVTGRALVRAAGTEQAGAVADELAEPSVTATASSVAAQDLITRPQAAVDDDPTTAWRPAADDVEPVLTLGWDTAAALEGLELRYPDDGVSSVPARVRLDFVPLGADATPDSVERAVDDEGMVSFPPVTTRGVTVTFLKVAGPISSDSATASQSLSPIAVAEVSLVGGPTVDYGAEQVGTLACGRGPTVSVAGEEIATAVRASARDIVEGRPLPAALCDRPLLSTGDNLVTLQASFTWVPLGLTLSEPTGELGILDDPAQLSTSAGAFALEVDPGDLDLTLRGSGTRTVALAIPAGKGWTARADDGTVLPSATIDGWAQGWVVPDGVDQLSLDYSAGDSLRWGAGLGALGWLVALGSPLSPLARRRDQVRTGRSTQA